MVDYPEDSKINTLHWDIHAAGKICLWRHLYPGKRYNQQPAGNHICDHLCVQTGLIDT